MDALLLSPHEQLVRIIVTLDALESLKHLQVILSDLVQLHDALGVVK